MLEIGALYKDCRDDSRFKLLSIINFNENSEPHSSDMVEVHDIKADVYLAIRKCEFEELYSMVSS